MDIEHIPPPIEVEMLQVEGAHSNEVIFDLETTGRGKLSLNI